jgi:hypothetical protein
MSASGDVVVRKLEVDDFGKGAVPEHGSDMVAEALELMLLLELGTTFCRLLGSTRAADNGGRYQSRRVHWCAQQPVMNALQGHSRDSTV